MDTLNIDSIKKYVEENIGVFHQKRLNRIQKLNLHTILRKKNPYLFKAKNIQTAAELVQNIFDAFLSSNEETLFGEWLEGLAIFVNQSVYGGWKSGIPGIDLEFNKDGIRYIVNIKSGPHWGNSSQIKKMRDDFNKAKRTLRTSNAQIRVIAVNGCCYGKDNQPDKGDYYKFCGQRFWEFISGSENLYTDIIEPLGHKAKEKNNIFLTEYARVLNKFTRQFLVEFCDADGNILWEKLVAFNSAKN